MRQSGGPLSGTATIRTEREPPITSAAVDLSRARRIHVVGAGGAGMSAIATVLVAMGHTVSGSDRVASPALERLADLGVSVAAGHAARHVAGADLVTASTAVGPDTPELVAARGAGVPIVDRAGVLSAICAAKRTVAVAGTHGKTTTTAMLAMVLRRAGLAPSFLLGAEVRGLGTGAVWDSGDLFVVEADESDGTFLSLGAQACILTSVEPDHLDHHGSFEALRAAFERFLRAVPGPRVVCADDPVAAALAESVECHTYGTNPAAGYRLMDVAYQREATSFTLVHEGDELARLELPVPGLHNARNAAAALVAGLALEAPIEAATAALAAFGGVARRFERRGKVGGVTFVDDYAHLPTEVRAALAAARGSGWDRVVAVFQPHRYTRTAELWRELGDSLEDADVAVVTDVYPAGQAPIPGVTAKLVVEAVLDGHPRRRVAWLPGRGDLVNYLVAVLRPGDLCLTLGAGDLTTLPDDVMAALAARLPIPTGRRAPLEP